MAKDLEDYLNEVSYDFIKAQYKPSQFALEFITFIKLVNGGDGEENSSPVIHYDMLDQLLVSRQNLFVSFRGSAKALALDTPIMTPTGNVPIGELEVGDTVFDRNGEKTKVTNVSEIFNNDTYTFKLSDGSTFIANEDHYHIVHVRTIKKVEGKNVNYFKEQELTTSEIIKRGVHYKRTVTNKCPYGKEVKWFIPLVSKEVDYDFKPTPMDPYTVGFILGDGNIATSSGMLSLTSEDKDFEECLSYIPYKHGIVYKDKRNTNTLTTRLHGLSKLVLTHIGDKTCLDKTIPSDYLYNSVEVRLELLRGLMDTDGTVSRKGRCSFTSASKSLAEGVFHIVKSLGANATIKRYENSFRGYYSVAFSLQNHNPFKLRRKADRWVSNTKYKAGPRVSILSIEKTPVPVPSRCISVSSPTKSFLIENSVVTRNTSVLHEYLILFLATYGRIPGFGEVNVGMYISDTMDNGIKSMRTNLEFRWNNSEFLQTYVPSAKFTDVRWEFQNLEGKKLCFRGFGASPLALDEVVHTENGTTTMEDVAIGDRVYGSNGVLATVIKKSEVFYKDMYLVTLKDGRSLKVSIDHLNSVYVKVSGKFTKNVLTTEELLRYSIKLTGKNEYKLAVPLCEPVQYPVRELPVCPYTLGLILGDGRSRVDGSNNLSGGVEDLEFYSKHIPYPLGAIYTDKRGDTVGDLPIKRVYKGMRELGVQGCSTYDKFIPEIYKTASVEQRLELVRGLMDTDGTVYGNGRVSFTNTSALLIAGLKNIIESLGGYTSMKTNPAHTREFKGYSSDCRESYTLSIFIRLNIFKLPRKADKFVLKDKYNKVTIKSIEKIDSVPSQCIGLDNENHEFVSTNYFVTHNTGVRGFKEYGQRPTWAGFDDLLSDKNAESSTITEDIKKIVYKAARQALSPRKRMQVWTGTPFNKSDPLYEATVGTAWNVRTYPICEKFPCTKEEFKGAWEDRFDYGFVKHEYESLLASGEIGAFNQELMLRITSEEDRLIQDHDIVWCKRELVWKNRQAYNFYITTDLATTDQAKGDFSVIGVWAYSNNKDWILIDGVCKRQLMDKNINDLFRFVSMYKPLSVGIEVNGQQGGFIQWIKEQMLTRKTFFSLAGKNGAEGIRRTKKKIDYLKTFLPVIKTKKLWICEELRESELGVELLDEFKFVTSEKFKSRNDDACDMVTMLQEMEPFAPSGEVNIDYVDSEDGTFAFSSPGDDEDIYKNSLVF